MFEYLVTWEIAIEFPTRGGGFTQGLPSFTETVVIRSRSPNLADEFICNAGSLQVQSLTRGLISGSAGLSRAGAQLHFIDCTVDRMF